MNKILQGDCLEVMKTLASNSVDAIVTDPPYGLSFMGKHWDYDVPSVEIWKEALRVLKPGGYLLSFAGTRTQHRMAVNIEDAGFEIRDMIAWVYGSGFPKSHNVANAVDKYFGAPNRGHAISSGSQIHPTTGEKRANGELLPAYTARTDQGKQWEGWGTALKPALEPITVARKPLSEKTVAQNVLKWGTGGINIDGSRVAHLSEADRASATPQGRATAKSGALAGGTQHRGERSEFNRPDTSTGRFPANFIHDGSDEVMGLFPDSKSTGGKNGGKLGQSIYGKFANETLGANAGGLGDSGSAARFFYCAKASKGERNTGCEGLEEKSFGFSGGANGAIDRDEGYDEGQGIGLNRIQKMKNNHPTVKPIALMQYLVTLVSREGATVLDPFAGSGSTLIACKKLGRDYIGIEMEEDYCKIAEARLQGVPNTLF